MYVPVNHNKSEIVHRCFFLIFTSSAVSVTHNHQCQVITLFQSPWAPNFLLCVGLLLLDMCPPWSVVNRHNVAPSDKASWPVQVSVNFRNFLFKGMNLWSCSSLNTGTPCGWSLCTPCVCCHSLCRFMCVWVLLYLEDSFFGARSSGCFSLFSV